MGVGLSKVISQWSPDEPVRHDDSARPSTAHSGPLFGRLHNSVGHGT